MKEYYIKSKEDILDTHVYYVHHAVYGGNTWYLSKVSQDVICVVTQELIPKDESCYQAVYSFSPSRLQYISVKGMKLLVRQAGIRRPYRRKSKLEVNDEATDTAKAS
jgi:hypothetical protein